MIRFGTTLAILLSVTTAAADISESTEVLPTARIFRGATLTNAADSGRVFLGAGAKIILFEVISHDSLVEVIELQLPVLVKALYLSDELLIALDLVSGIYF